MSVAPNNSGACNHLQMIQVQPVGWRLAILLRADHVYGNFNGQKIRVKKSEFAEKNRNDVGERNRKASKYKTSRMPDVLGKGLTSLFIHKSRWRFTSYSQLEVRTRLRSDSPNDLSLPCHWVCPLTPVCPSICAGKVWSRLVLGWQVLLLVGQIAPPAPACSKWRAHHLISDPQPQDQESGICDCWDESSI